MYQSFSGDISSLKINSNSRKLGTNKEHMDEQELVNQDLERETVITNYENINNNY